MWTKNHRFRCAVWCIYLRRVDFLCMNIDWNFDEKASIVAWFLLLLPSACWFFRIKNYVNFMYGFGNLKLRFRKFWKLNKTTKMNANSYFIFRRFGDGENRFWSKTNAFSYFIFFFGTSRWGSDMRRAEMSGKIHISVYKPKLTVSKKWSFLKILKNKWRLARAAKDFLRIKFGGDSGWHAWPVGGF